MIAMWLPVVAVCLWSLGDYVVPVDSQSCFMGGVIHWRPVNPAAFDGRVQITRRVTLRQTTCTQATIDTATLNAESQLVCQSGCLGSIGGTILNCADFMTSDGWSTGEQMYTYIFSGAESYFEASNELSTGELRVWGNLTYREDTGLINSSPVVNIPPLIRLQHGCSHTIKIPVEDADGDFVRCRWADECRDVCRKFPANLNGRDCEIQYVASNFTGDYSVALQVEDFLSSTDIIPLSSVPVQFVVRVQNIISNPPCSSQPEFVGTTPSDEACIAVPFNTLWNATITARVSSSCTAHYIADFVTASPLGMKKSDLVQSSDNPGERQMNVTWTPTHSQFGPNIFCYAAVDDIGLQSAHRCVTLLAGTEPPMVLPDSMSPKDRIFCNHFESVWSFSIQFNKQFIRPTRDTFVRIFSDEGEEVFTINVRTSAAVTYPRDALDHTLTFDINCYKLPENHAFYILLDAGVATGIEFCHAESPPVTDPTLWTFVTAIHTDNSIMTTTVCTIMFFIFGVICGLIAYCCVSTLWKRNFEQRQAPALHDEVNEPVITTQMVFNRNIAYRQT